MDKKENQDKDTTELSASSLSDNRMLLQKIFCESHKSICWYTKDLDFLISNNMETYQTILDFCKSTPNASVKILLHDSRSLVNKGHCLISLIQRLPSSIEVKATDNDYAHKDFSTYVVGDNDKVYHRPIESQWNGKLLLHNPLKVQNWLAKFKAAWDMSPTDSQLRLL